MNSKRIMVLLVLLPLVALLTNLNKSDAVDQDVTDIQVKDNIVYLAIRNEGLHIIDISKLDEPYTVSFLDISGTIDNIYLKDDLAYLTLSNNCIILANVDTPESPSIINKLNNNDYPMDIVVENDTLFFRSNFEISIFNVSDPENIFSISKYNVTKTIQGFAISNSIAFVSYNDTLRLLDFSNLTDISVFREYSYDLYKNELFVKDDYLFAFTHEFNSPDGYLLSFNYDNPMALQVIGSKNIDSSGNDIFVSAEYLLICQGNSFEAYNIENPSNIESYCFYVFNYENTYRICGHSNTIFITSDDRFYIVDISNSKNPIIIYTYDINEPHIRKNYTKVIVTSSIIGGIVILSSVVLIWKRKAIATKIQLRKDGKQTKRTRKSANRRAILWASIAFTIVYILIFSIFWNYEYFWLFEGLFPSIIGGFFIGFLSFRKDWWKLGLVFVGIIFIKELILFQGVGISEIAHYSQSTSTVVALVSVVLGHFIGRRHWDDQIEEKPTDEDLVESNNDKHIQQEEPIKMEEIN